jgi:hypothetical protein
MTGPDNEATDENELIRFGAKALQAAADGDEDAARAALAHLDPDLAGQIASLLIKLMQAPAEP